MAHEFSTQNVEILNQSFRIQCSPAKAQELQHCARYVESKVQEVREQGKALSVDRQAIMAALNIAHELMTEQRQWTAYVEAMGAQIRELQNKIENILTQPPE